MATPNDPARLSVGPFNTAQRQRLEALTAAKMLLSKRVYDHPGWHDETPGVHPLVALADYIVEGNVP